MIQTELTQEEIDSVFEQLDLRTDDKRAARAFSSFSFQDDEVSGFVRTRMTNDASDQ